MTTPQEFLKIVENNLILQDNGNVTLQIQDQKLAQAYKDFLTEHAKKEAAVPALAGGITVNIYCPQH
jgi:hypothetical protein